MTAETEITAAAHRAIELPADAQGAVDLFHATSNHEHVPWFPTGEQLRNDWRRTGTFGALGLHESFGSRPLRRYVFYRKPF
jgi:hypothetical protein